NSEVEELTKALKVNKLKIESKGIKSIRSRVANISEYLDEELTMDGFKELILKSVFDVEDLKHVPEFVLTEEDWDNIHEISKNRYQDWQWNYGKSPAFNIQESHKFPAGLVDVRLNVKNGIIEDATIFGDFFGVGNIADLEQKIIGLRHDRNAIEEALED